MDPAPAAFLTDFLPKLHSERITYFPIRHHSPACAAHLRRWILANQPSGILVEGPASFTSKIDLLVDERCRCPVALYTTFIDRRGRLRSEGTAEAETLPDFGPARFAAFYPLCDYSPELVALRTGKSLGARLRFIDLEYPRMVLDRWQNRATEEEPETVRVESLGADPHLAHSQYLATAARQFGCRDFNELWDHLFEAAWDGLDTKAFMERVATYCALARLDFTTESLRQDGTLAREACMAAAIREELEHNAKAGESRPILVVTGGLHTVALPDLVASKTPPPKPFALAEDETGNWLMRYSFNQLDALAGYAAGMPSPAFYDRLWQVSAEGSGGAARREQAGADLLVEIARLTRERGLASAGTTPDVIAAVAMARQLAEFRGHPWPLREDVLDGLRSCFVKGELATEGAALVRLAQEVLTGDKVGQVPPGTGVPPIVDDFHREARRLRLPVDSVHSREVHLDLYRNTAHRQTSRLLHRLNLLGVPFAVFLGGPDFVQGTGLELLQEHWQAAWSPATDGALIEAAVFGATIEEAAAAKLQQEIAQLEAEGQGRSTAVAVDLLIRACRLGLQSQAAALVPLIDIYIAEDPGFPSVVTGLSQLELLAHSREALEAGHLTALPLLSTAAYQRACRLLPDQVTCPDELVEPVLGSLRTLREIVAGQAKSESGLDADLFYQALARIVAQAPDKAQAAVVGAAAGILFSDGHLDEAGLIRLVSGYLGGTSQEARRTTGILRGLLATARAVAWQLVALLQAIDEQLGSWDEDTFLQALPDLRLAFTDLTPREIFQVADQVAGLHGEKTLGDLVHTDLDEGEVRFGLEINRRVRETLQAEASRGASAPGGA